MKYKELSKDYNQSLMELDTIESWDKQDIFKKVQEHRKDAKPFVFFEGPPTANGRPGVHHVMARTVKDIVCRYKTMKGFFVDRTGGWDTHGLPVEIEVEKQLGLSSKKEVEAYGIDKFNKACRESVFTYLKEWEEVTKRIGYWVDLDNPYITCNNDYIESIWWLLSQYFEKDMIYKGHRIIQYCPRCGTGLSDHEVAQGYKETEDPSVFVKFKIKSMENTFFLVWTTTPWTLLSNVALATHPDQEYVKVESKGEYFILVKERAKVIFGEDIKFIESFKGSQLAGIEYERLYDFVDVEEKGWYVINAEYVTIDDGTGVVHIAPAFGKEDYDEGRKYNLPMVQLVDSAGNIPPDATPFAGKFIKDADPDIIKDLYDRGLMFHSGKVKHSYAFCWRCKSPLIQYARASWYIKTTLYADKMIEANEKINWYPKTIGQGRFGEWLRNNIDWALSRERYWGTPLNIWICEDCKKMKSVGSIEQLRAESIEPLGDDVDLHRPYVDNIKFKCECGGTMNRTEEVIDCWFDSGGMPFAQMHYPFEHKEDFDKKYFPADFISEGVDQTRGWFYTLLAISTFIKGTSPYKDCVVIGLVLDKEGRKMSKSLGNSIAPADFWEKWGADPLRWFLVSNSQPWLPTKIDVDMVGEVSSKVFDTLRNVYKFFTTYANIDNFVPGELPVEDLSVLDKWILSRIQSLGIKISELMASYDMTRSARIITEFVNDELSNWYVRRSRRRFWGTGIDKDKNAAYHTLHYVLITVSKIIAPFAPMTADAYYTMLSGKMESVHMEIFPDDDNTFVNKVLEAEMEAALKITNVGRATRSKAKIKIRQPLREIFAKGISTDISDDVMELIKDELNVKAVKSGEGQEFTQLAAKPNFRTLGRKLGKHVNVGKEIITHLEQDMLKKVEESENIFINIEGVDHELHPEDLILEQIDDPRYVNVTENGITISICNEIDEEMLTEGLARELINRIQNSRKNAGFEVVDRIKLSIEGPEHIVEAAERLKDYILSETLGEEMSFDKPEDCEYTEEWNINESKVTIHLSRI